jgi:hypothetical protein
MCTYHYAKLAFLVLTESETSPYAPLFLSLILVLFCYSLTFDQLPPLTFIFSFLCRVFMNVVYIEND